MRPFPWIIRVSLFAVGFGIGLSHHEAPAPQRPVVLELHLSIKPQPYNQLTGSELRCVAPSPLRSGL